MRKILFLLILFPVVNLHAGDDYYWYWDQRIPLERMTTKRFILFENIDDIAGLMAELGISERSGILEFEETNLRGIIEPLDFEVKEKTMWAIIHDEEGITGPTRFSDNENVLYESGFYMAPGGIECGISHLFYVKLRTPDDLPELEDLARANKVNILGRNRFMPLWYTLSCTVESSGDALEMANLFYESSLFAASEPDLMIMDPFLCVNDSLFSYQWNLENTGQHGGIQGVDVNFCQARSITTGDQNIIIAVVDKGIKLNHPDLPNIHHLSFDAWTGESPSVIRGDHGTRCAGIIGASSNNDIGISGIAPGCMLMSISSQGGLQSGEKWADGINFAWDNGAAVISNSWTCSQLQILDDAIEDALTNGRGGLGSVVVFGAGNADTEGVFYPANSNRDIIAVGAISQCGERKSRLSCDYDEEDDEYTDWGSNWGDELDVMAPGIFIPTTDTVGYSLHFDGTSAACAHVSAVAGLILSENPALHHWQVSGIIKATARKTGGYDYQLTGGRRYGSWHNQMGYGLVDAYCALMHAHPLNLSNLTLTGEHAHERFLIDVEDVTVSEGADVTLRGYNIRINGPFEVRVGAKFVAGHPNGLSCSGQ